MTTRRSFLGALGLPLVAPLPGLRTGLDPSALELPTGSGDPAIDAGDEDFWAAIGAAFTVDRSMLNLNNGGVSPAPAAVQAAHRRFLEDAHHAPAYVMWRRQQPQREYVRRGLARLAGVSAEEIAIQRNASEALQTCQFGLDLARGDEVVATDQDYPRMLTTFRQRERRDGIVLKTFPIPVPCDDPAEIVARYREALTPRTRMILVSHVINITGQILPVREICALGRERGIPVIVDGAHAFANVDFRIGELGCDFYGTSLHKWLFAPLGTGMLYVAKERIRELWPLMAAADTQDDDIRKFEEIGTHPIPTQLAIGAAITFHERIGAARKQARLLHLRDLWAERLRGLERVRFNTSLQPGAACGIANVGIDGVDTQRLASWLWSEHRIVVTPIQHTDVDGIRVTPSVYTTPAELDRFCEVMEDVAQNGLPS